MKSKTRAKILMIKMMMLIETEKNLVISLFISELFMVKWDLPYFNIGFPQAVLSQECLAGVGTLVLLEKRGVKQGLGEMINSVEERLFSY